ncbi:restriction endonuclease [Ureibacillus sp. FSL K6-8385]|uniref:restriction endonuclease n=1 Tax=Ureibacillus TaxID=160795 RepID=UPI002E1A6E4D|nr:restriction endonuclease [Ureibacillus terrenus]MED3763640.1 restriction endonuclease [Ureibacillus terrenus]
MKNRKFGHKAIEFIIVSMFSFGIVITFISSFSAKPDIYDVKLHFMLFIAAAIFYKPFRTSSFRFIFYSVCRFIKLIKSGKKEIDLKQINRSQDLEYLYFLKSIFEKQGYVAVVSKELESFDVDLILWKGTKKYIVQSINSRNAADIRSIQIVQSKKKTYGADEAIIISGQFTASAKRYASLHHIRLIKSDELTETASCENNKKYIFQSALSYILPAFPDSNLWTPKNLFYKKSNRIFQIFLYFL